MRTASIGNKHKGRMVGGYLPPWMHTYISLYSLATGVTKTTIFAEIVQRWIVEQQTTNTEEALTEKLINRINSNWGVTKIITPELTYREYCERLEQELTEKGLTKTQIENVMNKLKY